MNLETARAQLLRAGVTLDATTIKYEHLNELWYLEWIWDTIVQTPFDRERAEYLIEMNIQRTFAAVARRANG